MWKVRDAPPTSPTTLSGQSILARHCFTVLPIVPAPLSYLGLRTARLPQTLTGHLNCLVCTGELRGLHQSLLPSLAVGIRDPHQICSLERERGEGGVRKKDCLSVDSLVTVGTKESRDKFGSQGPM